MQRIRLLLINLVLLFSILPSIITVNSVDSNWITVISINEIPSGLKLSTSQPLISGQTYNLTIQVAIPYNQPLAGFELEVNQELQKIDNQYWYILTKNYKGLDPKLYVPGLSIVKFIQIEGIIRISSIFKIPSTITSIKSGEDTKRFIKTEYQVISCKVTGGTLVGYTKLTISDAFIEEYKSTKNKVQNLIAYKQVDSTYRSLISDIIIKTDSILESGYPSTATSILQTLKTENLPPPPNLDFQTTLTVALTATLILTGAIVLLFIRARGRSNTLSAILTEASNSIATLEVLADRYDHKLATQLHEIRERLLEES